MKTKSQTDLAFSIAWEGRCLVDTVCERSVLSQCLTSCYITMPQFCHNVWCCWRNMPDLMHYMRTHCVDVALQFMVVSGAEQRFKILQIKFLIFVTQFLRSCQSGAHGTCHTCSGVRRKFPRGWPSFVTIVWRHKSTSGEVPKARPFSGCPGAYPWKILQNYT